MIRMQLPKTWMLAMGSVVVGAGLLGSSALISAQAPVETPTPTDQTVPGVNDQDMDRTYADFLADELDITVDELRQAEADARDAYIDHLVDAGDLDEERAVALKVMMPGQVIAGMMGEHEPGLDIIESAVISKIAEALDMDRQELRDELEEGRSVGEIAEDQGVEPSEAREELRDAADDVIDRLQQAGILTQDEVEQLRSEINEMIDEMFRDHPPDTPDFDTDMDRNDFDNDVNGNGLPDVPTPDTGNN